MGELYVSKDVNYKTESFIDFDDHSPEHESKNDDQESIPLAFIKGIFNSVFERVDFTKISTRTYIRFTIVILAFFIFLYLIYIILKKKFNKKN